ncbi:MAG TPA: MFS transporter, partial [Microbacterium ginsengisoli]|nr:MFS transporter [Microbacterium ginsengisoli]
FFHQNGPYPGSAFGYRTKDEEASWRERDPIALLGGRLRSLGIASDAELDAVRDQAVAAMVDAVAALVEDDPDNAGRRRIRPELWPDPAVVDTGIRGDESELADAAASDPIVFDGPWRDIRFVDAVAAVMDRRMSEDERIVVLGEDV